MTSLKIIQVRHIQLICVFGCAKNLNEVKNLWKITREILRFFTQWLANIGEIPDNLALKIPWTVFVQFLIFKHFKVHFLSFSGSFDIFCPFSVHFWSIFSLSVYFDCFFVHFDSIFGLFSVHFWSIFSPFRFIFSLIQVQFQSIQGLFLVNFRPIFTIQMVNFRPFKFSRQKRSCLKTP